MLEAMRAGVPTVCGNTDALPEVAGDAAVLVNPFSGVDIAEGLSAVLSDAGLAHRLCEAGARQVNRFDWNVSARRLVNNYRNL